jgi:hypothetical protein
MAFRQLFDSREKDGYTGCSLWSLLHRHQPAATVGETTHPSVDTTSEEKSQWDVILNNGSVETFAPLNVEMVKKEEQRPQLIIRPYFGSFAGHKVTFDLKKTDTIKVKIEGCTHRLTLYHRNDSKLLGVRDRCLRFAHDAGSHQLVNLRNSWSSSNQSPFRKKPLSLKFLCEQTMLVHLHKLPMEGLPARYKHFLTSNSYQDITINVRPKKCRPTPTLLMRVKKNLSVSELEWMICHRLSLQDPTPMKIYHNNFLSPLDSDSTILPTYTQLECVLEPSTLHLLPDLHPRQRQVLVSVVGQGMKEITVEEDWTFGMLESALREAFSLQFDSFLYIPAIMRSHKDIRMLVPLVQSNMEIIGQRIPMLGQEMESFRSQTLQDLGVFNHGLLGVFEVNSPAIPVYVRSFVCMDSLSLGDNFAFVAVKPFVVALNPAWSTDIFFKYIESISGFPCQGLCVGKKRVEGGVSVLLSKSWVKIKNGRLLLKKDIPQIVYG